MWGALASAAIPLASSLFQGRKGNNPGQAAQQALQRIPEYGYKAYNPFIEQGQQAYNQLSPEYQNLLGQRPNYSGMAEDPTGFLRGLEGGYQESPGFQHRLMQALKAAGNTAASGGLTGTENDVMNRSGIVNKMLQGDMQQYLENVLGIHGRGIEGQERQYMLGLEGLGKREDRGFDASSKLADYLGGAAGQEAGSNMYGRAYQNKMNNNSFNALHDLINTGIDKWPQSPATKAIKKSGAGGGFGGGAMFGGGMPQQNAWDRSGLGGGGSSWANSGLGQAVSQWARSGMGGF